jgi:hypothetical protein
MELAAFLPNRRGAAIDLSPSKAQHTVSIGTCGSAFIDVLLVSEFGRHLENVCFHFRSAPLQLTE